MTRKPDDFIPDPDFPEGHRHAAQNKRRCTAWSYGNSRQCLGLAMDNGKCRVHGGKSPKGIASPSFKTGKYSKALPKRFIQNYEQSRNNPEYLKLQDDIALIDSRLLELTHSIDTQSSFTIFQKLSDAVDEMQIARDIYRRTTDPDQKAKANIDFLKSIAKIENLTKQGAREWYIWNDITDLIEKRRRLVETERRLLVDMQMMINTQDVLVLMDAILDSVRQNVPDRDARQAIQQDFLRLTTR